MLRRIAAVLALVFAFRTQADAQLVVHDAAVTTRNTVTATIKELLVTLQREQHDRLRQMAARLSALTDLSRYAPSDPPEWHLAPLTGLPGSRDVERALQFGDSDGRSYAGVVQPIDLPDALLARLSPASRRLVSSALATLEATDATMMAAIDDVGQLRDSARSHEAGAIDALASSVLDGSAAQSATAALEKTAGASIIGAQQRQARIRLLNHLVEQLLVDAKRSRDTDATALNMQLTTWQSAEAANRALIHGTADALTSWRQP